MSSAILSTLIADLKTVSALNNVQNVDMANASNMGSGKLGNALKRALRQRAGGNKNISCYQLIVNLK